jgi:hypothetical protein
MSQSRVIFPATTDAVTAKQPFETAGYQAVTVAADVLAGAEEADLFVSVNGTWKTLVDLTGTAVKLTATITMVTLEGGPLYAVTKDSTASACTVVVIPQVVI